MKTGLIEGKYYFEGNNLIKVENLTLIADDIVLIGNILLNNEGYLEKIDITEFVRELDNYSASISFQQNDNFRLFIKGKSININNYFSDSNNDNTNGTIDIETNNFYLNGLNLGSVKLSSVVKRNEINRLFGDIYNQDKKLCFFYLQFNSSDFSKFKINFKDFGLISFLIQIFLINLSQVMEI